MACEKIVPGKLHGVDGPQKGAFVRAAASDSRQSGRMFPAMGTGVWRRRVERRGGDRLAAAVAEGKCEAGKPVETGAAEGARSIAEIEGPSAPDAPRWEYHPDDSVEGKPGPSNGALNESHSAIVQRGDERSGAPPKKNESW